MKLTTKVIWSIISQTINLLKYKIKQYDFDDVNYYIYEGKIIGWTLIKLEVFGLQRCY